MKEERVVLARFIRILSALKARNGINIQVVLIHRKLE